MCPKNSYTKQPSVNSKIKHKRHRRIVIITQFHKNSSNRHPTVIKVLLIKINDILSSTHACQDIFEPLEIGYFPEYIVSDFEGTVRRYCSCLFRSFFRSSYFSPERWKFAPAVTISLRFPRPLSRASVHIDSERLTRSNVRTCRGTQCRALQTVLFILRLFHSTFLASVSLTGVARVDARR